MVHSFYDFVILYGSPSSRLFVNVLLKKTGFWPVLMSPFFWFEASYLLRYYTGYIPEYCTKLAQYQQSANRHNCDTYSCLLFFNRSISETGMLDPNNIFCVFCI